MIDPNLTFARFEVGATNELAASAARRVAESPGRTYNPLVIRGDVGAGRTHLLHAIANHARSIQRELRVRLESAESIADLVTTRLVADALGSLDDPFASISILLLDELERISGLERTQDELARLGARMVDERRQIVFASLVPPAELPGLTPEFRRLLARGTVIDIDPPDASVRRAIARRVAGDLGAVLPEDLLRAIGEQDLRDGRGIEATVRRMLRFAADEARPPSRQDLLRALPDGISTADGMDEFGTFLTDISLTLETVVETAPWRRRIGEAILRWEAEGIPTSRLEHALEADTPPDVDAILDAFARDASRLLETRAALGGLPEGKTLDDAGEAAPAATAGRGRHRVGIGTVGSTETDDAKGRGAHPADAWFLDPRKVILDWTEIDARVVDGAG